MVAHVFHSVAAKYDVMNDLMSFGIHRLWKRFTIDCSGAPRADRAGLAGGTGDLTAKFLPPGGNGFADMLISMILCFQMGREKLRNIGIVGNVEYVQAQRGSPALFADNTFDCITISFGLRNVTDKALRSMYRVLKPDGRLLVLGFLNHYRTAEQSLRRLLLPDPVFNDQKVSKFVTT